MNGRRSEDDVACRTIAGRIQALADGSLDPDQARDAEAHCSACPSCGALLAEARSVWSLLLEDQEPVPSGRIWPLVHERLHPGRTLAARLSWAGATAFAAAAGLAIGILLAPGGAATTEAWEQATWGEVGSLLADGTGLDQIYLDVPEEMTNGEARP